MTDRQRLANRRHVETIAVEVEGQRFKVGLGRELDCGWQLGPIVEVWLNAQKVNSPIDVLVSDGAILMSLLIQYGCPPAEIVKSMNHSSDGKPASPFGVAAALINQPTRQGDGDARPIAAEAKRAIRSATSLAVM
jgi:hypothetical protein